MEWREQSAVSCEEAYLEAQRWIEAVTEKQFGSQDFRSALENGVLLCDLVNKIHRGLIRRVNRLSTPIAGLDNLNVFLKACKKLGLKEAQLFHPGDLQDLSSRVTVKPQETSRRLKNVLITIYWLGRQAFYDSFYDGPNLNLKSFEGLLGTALSKALEEGSSPRRSSVRDSGFGDSWYSDREELFQLRGGGRGGEGGGEGYSKEDSSDSLDSLGSRPHSISSDATLKGSSEGWCSDAEADPVCVTMTTNKDSLSYRRSLTTQPKPVAQFNQFLPSKDKPSGYVPAPLRKKRAERNEDNRRSWASPLYTEEDGTFTRSKSMSDIVDPAVVKQVYREEIKKVQEQVKESDDKWQDDLSKWKSRRKSVNSDIVKKKEEREQIEQNYGGDIGSGRTRRSLKDMQEERASRDSRRSVGSRLSSLSYLDEDEDVFAVPIPAPRSRSLYGRSNTADDLYSPPERSPAPSPAPSRPSIPSTEDEEPAARPAPGRPASPPPPQEAAPSRAVTGGGTRASSTVTTVTSSSVSSNSSSAYAVRSADLPARPRSISPAQEPSVTVMADAGKTPSPSPEPRSLVSKAPEPWRPKAGVRTAEKKEAPQHNPTMPPGVSRVSASLPRSTQRADSTTRLSSVIMPRPFGTQATRLSSLTRAPVTVDSHRRVNGDADVNTKSSVPGRYQQYMTLEDEASSQSSGEDEEEEEEGEDEANEEEGVGKGLSSNSKSVSQEPPRVKSETPALGSDASQENFSDMRISLNQKPNSSRDFGFHADWSASGTRVKSIQPGSPAEMLRAGDEILSVSGHRVADMSYAEWGASMEDALQQGSLTMDVRRRGGNNWDTDRPAAPFQNHKTINLTSSDHSTLVGGVGSNTSPTNTSLDFTSRKSPDGLGINAAPLHSVVNVATNGLNGGVHQEAVTMRNKESEPMSLKNLKRRSEFFEQGGSETAISDIPVPALTPSASRWSWDPEEERRRQEKWQKEQDRLLQEKYKRDQEEMQEIWRKDQEEAYDSRQTQKTQSLEVDAARPSSTTRRSPAWEAQEEEEEVRRRKEAQEEQRQAEQRRRQEEEEELELRRFKEERERREQLQRRREAEEKERREEEEERREEERMKRTEELKKRAEEERKRRAEEEERVRRAAEEERKMRMEEDLRLQRRRVEERQEEERRRALDKQQQWKPSGFRSSQSHTLAYSDREKSKSTPEALDDVGFSERRGRYRPQGGSSYWAPEERSGRERYSYSGNQRLEARVTERILSTSRYREPQRAASGLVAADRPQRRSQQQLQTQADLERQQILQDMKKKTQLLTDNSWIRQQSTSMAPSKEPVDVPMRRGESLDNLDAPRSAWRSSWTPGSTSSIPSSTRPQSAIYGSSGAGGVVGGGTYYGGGYPARPGSVSGPPASASTGSLRGGAAPPASSWRQQSPSLSPTTSPEPTSEPFGRQQRSRSVSGKKICTFCDSPLGKGAAMIIESLGLCYHLNCFKCMDCKSDLGGSEAGAEVRIRNKHLYCNTCYQRFKAGQPTSM
ncbi:LIM domain only protein 7 isoform X3 [Gadus morhua]|uniref:LIM domain only protein 7 isoform X3 n=1 Tax=Gadus morhua TaxID=8049 RepID=UPI0011B7002C|nr:LIM domain only protein 7 isoform X3 [Gadus morhua]